MARFEVGYLIGGLSKESINRKLAEALVGLAPDELVMKEIPIGELPLYNRDFDGDYPEVARGRYHPDLREFVLPWPEGGEDGPGDDDVLSFLDSAYSVAADRGDRNRADLEP